MKQPKAQDINKKVFLFFSLTFIAIGLALFLPAGSLNYWQAWTFMGVLFIPAIFIIFYFLKNDREFLERRLKFREKETQEKSIIKIALLLFFIGFLIPGLDYRYGWSNVPFWLVISSDIVVFLAYITVFFVFKENSYASRIIKVDKKQEVITTGPYAIVRHPMYAAVIPMFLCIPLALGSYFALIFFVPTVPVILFRILDEERVLLRDLKGYKEYTKKVKYRLIPLVW
ncbi:MAG: isoprenylcysteine carboxylmethyltransferase family protein [Candidatus Bathyarchaeota archaeon]|nr:MAG: isoprenylcysteine carboxylmethyltransferase family protein [Candidatus Bathyarchaeota archaeon]